MKKVLLLLLTLLFSSVIYSQENPERGFIITNNNDTIYGMLDFRTERLNSKQCTFKADNSDEYKTYTPDDIVGYRFMKNGKFYVSKQFEYENQKHTLFAEYMVKGMLSVYRVLDFDKYEVYFFEDEEGKVLAYRNVRNITKIDDTSTKNAQSLYTFVSKSLCAVEDVKIGNMSPKQVIKLAYDYHNDVCTSNEDCIQYEYDARNDLPRINFGVNGGIISFFSEDDGFSYSNIIPTFGVNLDIRLDRSAKNKLFQVSINYAYSNISPKFDTGSRVLYGKEIHNMFIFKLGPQWRFGEGHKTKFTSRFGVAGKLDFEYVKDTNEALHYKNDAHFTKISLLSLYGGVGVDIPVGKHDIVTNVDVFSPYKLFFSGSVSVAATVGYRF